MGSESWLTWVEARQGWSLVRWTMVFSPGMSAAVTMVNSCQGMAGSKCDGGDAAARDGAADGGSEPHAGEGDVVDVEGAAQNLCRALFA